MRRRLLTLFAVAMTAITLLIPSFASAAELPDGVILDETARDARTVFRQVDGCLTTRIRVSLSDDHQDWNDGSTYDLEYVSLVAWQENTCTEEMIFDIEFYSEEIPFKLKDNFSGASVSGSAVANNIVGDDMPVSFTVMWTPHGPRSATDDNGELTVFDPLTGQDVPAYQDATLFDRGAKASGTITIGDQTFRISDRSEDTFLFGFDNTWSLLAE
jgi:hypothetical protein